MTDVHLSIVESQLLTQQSINKKRKRDSVTKDSKTINSATLVGTNDVPSLYRLTGLQTVPTTLRSAMVSVRQRQDGNGINRMCPLGSQEHLYDLIFNDIKPSFDDLFDHTLHHCTKECRPRNFSSLMTSTSKINKPNVSNTTSAKSSTINTKQRDEKRKNIEDWVNGGANSTTGVESLDSIVQRFKNVKSMHTRQFAKELKDVRRQIANANANI